MTKDEFDALLRRAVLLWQEDDATPDAERSHAACARIWPYKHFGVGPHPESPIYVRDDGDVTYHVFAYSSYHIILRTSYPGNNAIYVSNVKEKTQ